MNVLTLFGACETHYISCSAHSFWDEAACFYDHWYTYKQSRTSFSIKDFKYTICSPECKMFQNNMNRQSSLNSLLIRGHKIRTWYLNTTQEEKWRTDYILLRCKCSALHTFAEKKLTASIFIMHAGTRFSWLVPSP